MKKRSAIALSTIFFTSIGVLAACKITSTESGNSTNKKIVAVGAENEYANVIDQIGGKYVDTNSIMSNPETDPHSYEASTKDASLVGKATLIVQNGVGYDDFMNKLENSSKDSKRTIINVGKSLNYSNNTKNPHLWYDPNTMPKVAKLVEENLEKQLPAQKDYFKKNLNKFIASLHNWRGEIASLKNKYSGTKVAVTEPVSDYLIDQSGLRNMTPWNYQAAVMNGTDPSPQDVKTQQDLFKNKKVKVFLYNRQAVDDSTTALLNLAKQNNIPVVGVYETMPTGYTYQKWMESETRAIIKAIENRRSTDKL